MWWGDWDLTVLEVGHACISSLADMLSTRLHGRTLCSYSQDSKIKEPENPHSNTAHNHMHARTHARRWGVQGKLLNINGRAVVGVAWYIINPKTKKTVNEGSFGIANAHLLFPTIAISNKKKGSGFIGFSVGGRLCRALRLIVVGFRVQGGRASHPATQAGPGASCPNCAFAPSSHQLAPKRPLAPDSPITRTLHPPITAPSG